MNIRIKILENNYLDGLTVFLVVVGLKVGLVDGLLLVVVGLLLTWIIPSCVEWNAQVYWKVPMAINV